MNSSEHQNHIQAFEEFYDNQSDGLYRYIYYKSSSTQIANDILQETFIRIFERYPTYASNDHRVRALYTIARNLLYDHFRKSKKTQSLDNQLIEPQDTGQSAGETIDINIANRQLARALNHLPNSDQEIIIAHSINELPYSKLSTLYNKKESAIRKQHSRALQKLASIFSELYGTNYKPY